MTKIWNEAYELYLEKSRFWTYRRDEWEPEHRWRHPGHYKRFFGGDEWNRWTIVLPIPFGGYLVTALWACPECKKGNIEHGDITMFGRLK